MEQKILSIVPRSEFGKSATKKLRSIGRIPVTVYGHTKAVSMSIDEREFHNQFKAMSESTIITLKGDKNERQVLIKDYQEDLLQDKILHIDFLEIEMGKVLRTHVPINLTGTAIGAKAGGVLEHLLHEVEVECLPKDLPHHIPVDITELQIGDSFHISELFLPSGIQVMNAEDQLIVHVSHKKAEIVEEVEEVEIEAEGEAEAEAEEE
jgi:large subunit ribosomal protein L25